MQYELLAATLPRTSSCKSTQSIVPSTFSRSSPLLPESNTTTNKSTIRKTGLITISTLLRSFLSIISFPAAIIPACRSLTIPTRLPVIKPSLPRKVIGTLFGHRRGHVSFAVQTDPRSDPVFLIELAVSTSSLVREMSSGLVRIALESEKGQAEKRGRPVKLFKEREWSMYFNGRKSGNALSRGCTESDSHVLSTVRSVSVGAGVIPVLDDGRKGSESEGELLYMRARFERVVGNRDSEAFYMINPDGNTGPELSIFLLRI